MSGSGVFEVTPGELVAAAGAIRGLLEGLSSGFAALDRDVVRLTDTWTGVQGERFAAGFADVREGVGALLDAIRDTTVALDAGAEAYLGQEGVNAAAIESVASLLNIDGVS